MRQTLLGPTSQSFISQRLRLNYVDWGNPDAPPLVLVHGGRDHCRNWDWVAEDLRRDYHVIAPDLRGHGDSAWSTSGDYSLNAFVYDLAQLIHQQHLAPCRIVAHSLGGNDQPALRRRLSGEREQAGGDRGAGPVAGDAGRARPARPGRTDAQLGRRHPQARRPESRAATPRWRTPSIACRPRIGTSLRSRPAISPCTARCRTRTAPIPGSSTTTSARSRRPTSPARRCRSCGATSAARSCS